MHSVCKSATEYTKQPFDLFPRLNKKMQSMENFYSIAPDEVLLNENEFVSLLITAVNINSEFPHNYS